jgi:hypothetical protein
MSIPVIDEKMNYYLSMIRPSPADLHTMAKHIVYYPVHGPRTILCSKGALYLMARSNTGYLV